MPSPFNMSSKRLFRLPDDMSFEEGALIEPTAVSFYGVEESRLKVGDTVKFNIELEKIHVFDKETEKAITN